MAMGPDGREEVLAPPREPGRRADTTDMTTFQGLSKATGAVSTGVFQFLPFETMLDVCGLCNFV